jgi:hypothetical protein
VQGFTPSDRTHRWLRVCIHRHLQCSTLTIHSSVGRALDCSSNSHWFDSGWMDFIFFSGCRVPEHASLCCTRGGTHARTSRNGLREPLPPDEMGVQVATSLDTQGRAQSQQDRAGHKDDVHYMWMLCTRCLETASNGFHLRTKSGCKSQPRWTPRDAPDRNRTERGIKTLPIMCT